MSKSYKNPIELQSEQKDHLQESAHAKEEYVHGISLNMSLHELLGSLMNIVHEMRRSQGCA